MTESNLKHCWNVKISGFNADERWILTFVWPMVANVLCRNRGARVGERRLMLGYDGSSNRVE